MIKSEEQLCWNCEYALGGCSWADSFVPVIGWKARKIQCKGYETYEIRECPQFKQETYKKRSEEKVCGNCVYYQDHKCEKRKYRLTTFYGTPCKYWEIKTNEL